MIASKQDAKRAARRGSYACFAAAASTLLIVGISAWTVPVFPWVNSYALVDAFLFLLLGIWAWRISKAASVIALVLYLAEIAWKLNYVGKAAFSPVQLLWTCLFLAAFLQGVRGAFAFDALKKADTRNQEVPSFTQNLSMTTIEFWGICPCDKPPCKHSYLNGDGLDYWLTGWISTNLMPGSGRPGKAELPVSYRKIFQPRSTEDGFCPECGTPLVFKVVLPSLGCCAECARKYNEADFSNQFCSSCGHPIEIRDGLEAEMAKQRKLAALFEQLPTLKKHGFLPTKMG